MYTSMTQVTIERLTVRFTLIDFHAIVTINTYRLNNIMIFFTSLGVNRLNYVHVNECKPCRLTVPVSALNICEILVTFGAAHTASALA